MCKKEDVWFLLVIILSLIIPLSHAYQGSSSTYNVDISDFSMAGFEETNTPNMSLEFFMGVSPTDVGNSTSYNVSLGLPKILGPIAFNISIFPNMAKNDSLINCTGFNIFSDKRQEMPKHYYRFTDGIGAINTNWSESNVVDCASVGYCNEPNITCHFKVDNSHVNSTEIEKTILVDTVSPVVTSISPANNTNFYNNFTWVFEYNVTDTHIVPSCSLIVNNEIVQTTILPEKDTLLNFTYYINNSIYIWHINCTDEADNIGVSETRLLMSYFENMWFENIGVTGFENISTDYTYTNQVIIKLTYADNANNCRLKNEDANWSAWTLCQPIIFWSLTDGDANKTVYIEINHSADIITNFSDWIILESNATHLDSTAPENFTVYDDALFTNKNNTLHFRWGMPRDSEVETLNQKISFTYRLKDSNGTYITTLNSTEGLETTLTNLTLIEGEKYILEVNATNPAGLSTVSQSNGTTIDLTPPIITSIIGYPDNVSWSNNNNLSFNWISIDTLSGVAGYSMILDNNLNTESDNVSEDNYSNNRTYENKDEETYYFHINAYDNAGNYGETYTYGPVRIDLTPPSKPVPINPIALATSNQIIFYWEKSIDNLSGLMKYNLTIIDNTTGILLTEANTTYENYTITNATDNHQYFLIVTAIDYAGNKISSEISRITPLEIISARPDGAIVAETPILMVETNKVAICKEDYTNNNFLYTNSTYHETRLDVESSNKNIRITCKDNDGFYATKTITYQVQLSAVIPSVQIGVINNTLIGKEVNVPVYVNGVSQINKNKFKVYIDNKDLSDFIVINLDDLGNYLIKFISQEAGTFDVKINIEGKEDTSTFTITNLKLNVEYVGVSSASSKSHLIYSDEEDKKVGLASDSKDVTLSTSGNKILLNSSGDGKTYLFFTKDNFNVNTKDKELTSNSFKTTTNSFGYPSDDGYKIKTSVGYDTISITGITELQAGTYSLFFRNIGFDKNNKTVISIEIE